MKEITYKENEKTIKGLQKGMQSSWDLFLYGNKEKNIKPGNIYVYGTIAGQREVLKDRQRLHEELVSDNCLE